MRRNARVPPAFPLVAIGLLATRLPLLGLGFGSDEDSWRNAVAALHGLAAGRYTPSRPPGFPVFELPLMLLVPLGPAATNLLAAVAGIVSAWGLHGVARRLGHRAPGLLALGWALAPPLWVHATQAMDYASGLAFMTTAWWALLARRPALAGMLLALAAGTRLTLGGLALPFAAWLLLAVRDRGALARFALSFLALTAAIYLPVTLLPEADAQGTGVLYHITRQHLTTATAPVAVWTNSTWAFGRLGLLAIVLGLVLVRLRRGVQPRTGGTAGAGMLEAGAIAVIVAAWALIPLDPGYLLPALPFAFSLLARALHPVWLAIVLAAGASEALVLPLPGSGRLAPGRLFLERDARRAQLAATADLRARDPGEPTVFVVGRANVQRLVALAPELERRAPAWAAFDGPGVALWNAARGVGFAATLSAAHRDSLTAAGLRIRD